MKISYIDLYNGYVAIKYKDINDSDKFMATLENRIKELEDELKRIKEENDEKQNTRN